MNAIKQNKLGKRLQQLESLVTGHYEHIWDCCCDHGLLGATLLSRAAAPNIHFVDTVANLINEVEEKLSRFCPDTADTKSKWQTHCLDASLLPLHAFSGNHLVIIAGVGGDLTSELVNAICRNNPTADIDFLLCPVHHQFTLRQQLIQLDLCLKTEQLITENQRFYEILLVSTQHSGLKIHPVGSLIWQTDSAEQIKINTSYLTKTLTHYRRAKRHHAAKVQDIVKAYEAIELTAGN